MSRRLAGWLAWSVFAFYLLVVAATLVLVASSAASDQIFVVMAFGFALVGALVAARESANPVGWLLLLAAVSVGLQELSVAYVAAGDRPGAVPVALFSIQLGWLYIAVVLLPLLFPTGRLLSPRWRLAVWMGVGGFVLSTVGQVIQEGTLDVDSAAEIQNPLGVGGPTADVLVVLGNVLLGVGLILSAVSVVLRLRRSRGRERRQLKLFAYVAVLAVAALALGLLSLLGGSAPEWELVGAIGWFSMIALLLLGLPIAIGVAILRHGLYDIDVVINRTLVYGALTILLAASYLGMVLLFRFVLSPLTGKSDLAVAGSTLAVAALFRPFRSRIQRIVDRRFFRQRYDAVDTLAGFSMGLRDELDLETLGVDLRRVVHDTVQPAHVSLWLREAGS